ncbi:hypothetical protein J5226_23180 [Lysobacter sp. K5869]|uniref:hypothetical protein n=1 Tax=Lysobacter sp. K5869 TaxID=2820808 RepID=UPI001C062D46|nr:hypothetical protein [Lysobacter sp. K5869]QWP76453.1 hypothetical protein J5226_23180 [Lysobacter sp. K5869]
MNVRAVCIAASVLTLALSSFAAAAAGGKGVTWRKASHANGVDRIGCFSPECDAYQGDTVCSARLPVLCLKQDGSPSPVPVDFYNGWAKGNIALSRAVRGDSFKSRAEADAFCRAEFGQGYRVGEHHDGGGGWGWQAYGNVDDTTRFWVTVNDQPSSCWN